MSSDVGVVDRVVDGMNEFSSNPQDVMYEFDSNSKQFGRFEISCCIHRDKNFRPSRLMSEGSVGFESTIAM